MTDDIPSRSRGDLYALSALRNRRAEIASKIVECERKMRHFRDSLVHVDACLKLLDPDADPDDIPNKRITRRVKLFGQGQLGRAILSALRQADGEPLTTFQIAESVAAAGGHGDGALRAIKPRVRGNLAYLERRGKINKMIGDRKGAMWRLLST